MGEINDNCSKIIFSKSLYKVGEVCNNISKIIAYGEIYMSPFREALNNN